MARVYTPSYSDDDDAFDSIYKGVNAGINLANAYQTAQNNKLVREESELRLDEFKKNAPVRQAQNNATLATSNNTKQEQENKLIQNQLQNKAIIGTSVSNVMYEASQVEDPTQQFALVERNLSGASGGALSVKFEPLQEGGFRGSFTTKDGGKADLFFKNFNELDAQIGRVRRDHGYVTFSEIEAAQRVNMTKDLFGRLKPEEQAKYGSWDVYGQDPNVIDAVDYMIANDKSFAESKQWHKENQYKDEDQNMQRDQHNQNMERGRLDIRNSNLLGEKYTLDIENSKEDRDYLEKVTRPYQEEINRLNLNQEYGQAIKVVDEVVEIMYPQFQATYENTNAEAGALGVGASTSTRKVYSDEQLKDKMYIVNTAQEYMNKRGLSLPIAITRAKGMLDKIKKSKSGPAQNPNDQSQDNKNNSDKENNKNANKTAPSKSRDNNSRDTSRAVPQPFNGALGVNTPTANELATNTSRAQESSDSIKRNLRNITEGSFSRERRERDEEIKRKYNFQ